MMIVKSEPMELRGIANKTSGKGNVYYTVNVESDDGTPHALYCPNAAAFAQGLKKGDNVRVTFEVSYFKGAERLNVAKVELVK